MSVLSSLLLGACFFHPTKYKAPKSFSPDPRLGGRGADDEQHAGGADLLHHVVVPAGAQAAAAAAPWRARAALLHFRKDHGQ